ncbi:GNAT family N-acetyltransferase [Anaerofustis stercorihominis]|uniref:GNAT family N-acetyltransferase n=1 Tax=Anaerofustis stercorihominis TaxID=214853 RepID=UPI001FAACA6A|nr:GNAT family N-acetyltransferase [Anaerofustis stercorihominis]MCQ4795821.1 GNAT family N-acetyltransferase [Anaerofustis stercorihominis]
MEKFLYNTIYIPDGSTPLDKSIIYNKEIYNYIEGVGKDDDIVLGCEYNNKIVALSWSRILNGEVKGYGNIDDKTPEIAISVLKGYRNKGMGTSLLKEHLKVLKNNNYKRVSLSVNKENYALDLYKKLGFDIIKENNEDYIMVLNFK